LADARAWRLIRARLIAALVGVIAAFVASMPVAGPVAALVVRHALHGEARAALLLAASAGIAEAAYAWLALWGFSTFLSDYPWVVPASKIVAGVILVVLGIVFTRYVPRDETAAVGAAPPSHPSPIAHTKTAVLAKERSDRPWSSFTVGFGV
jgi:threonine/homoserine/homoserine lactone efflux protein